MLSILIRTKSNIDQELFCGTDSVRILIVPAIELQPWSKRLGTLDEIRHKDALC